MAFPTLIPLTGDPATWVPPATGYVNIGVNAAGQIVTQQPNGVLSTGFFSSGLALVTVGSYTVLGTDVDISVNFAGTVTLTLGTPVNGRPLWICTATANAVISAASNVIPLAGGAAGPAILAATAGKWARLIGNGAQWVTTAGN